MLDGVNPIVAIRYSTYIQRIIASSDKWHNRQVRLLRDATTKSGTKFREGEILRVCGVSKLGTVDLSDDGKRMIIGFPRREIEVVGDVKDRVLAELQSSGKSFTVAELSRRITAPYASTRLVLKKLVEVGRVAVDGNRYHWVLPRKRRGSIYDYARTVWDRLREE
jgi:hypothetical protein